MSDFLTSSALGQCPTSSAEAASPHHPHPTTAPVENHDNTAALYEAAAKFHEAGISLVPVDRETKGPLIRLLPRVNGKPAWEPFQERQPSLAEARHWIKNGAQLAVVGGKISGGLLILDFDVSRFYDAWRKRVGSLADGLPVQRTGGRGYQVLLRCPDPGANQKLAWAPDSSEATGRTIAIETRANGGYGLVAPSLHPSGNFYQTIVGDLADVPTLSQADANTLLDAARALDEAPQIVAAAYPYERNCNAAGQGVSVIDAYNEAHSIHSTLERFGYVRKGSRYARPGGSSASVYIREDNCSYHFSTNDPSSDGYTHSPFDLFCHYQHNGNIKEAVKAAARELGMNKTDFSTSAESVSNGEPCITEPSSWPILHPDALCGLAGDIVRAIEPHTEADPCALLTQTLVAFGNAVGKGPYFPVEATRHTMNIFGVLVGASSKARKGTSLDHIVRLFQTVAPDWCERIVTGASSGEGLINAVRDPVMGMKPVKDKARAGDHEPYEIDPGVKDKRLLDIEPEFAQVLRVLAREGNTLSAQIRNAWDKGDLATLTKNSSLRATGAHISFIGHITGDELVRHMTSNEAGNGFANRFIWVCVRRSKWLPEGGRIQDVNFHAILQRLKIALETARDIKEMRRDEDARALWHQVYNDLSADVPGLIGSITARAEAQTMRLACIYALMDGSVIVREVHLRAALALWRYARASVGFIFGESLGDPVANKILLALSDAPEGLTTKEIHAALSNNFKGPTVRATLSTLIGSRRITEEPIKSQQGQPGRPGKIWRLAPSPESPDNAHSNVRANEKNELNPPSFGAEAACTLQSEPNETFLQTDQRETLPSSLDKHLFGGEEIDAAPAQDTHVIGYGQD